MTINLEKETLRKMIFQMLNDKFGSRYSMSEYLTELIMNSYSASNDFMLAYTDSFPKIVYAIGDKVRVMNQYLYNIDWITSREKGYAVDDSVYGKVIETFPYKLEQYKVEFIYIDSSGAVANRTNDVKYSSIAHDNTVVPAFPNRSIADII